MLVQFHEPNAYFKALYFSPNIQLTYYQYTYI